MNGSYDMIFLILWKMSVDVKQVVMNSESINESVDTGEKSNCPNFELKSMMSSRKSAEVSKIMK